MKTIFIGAGNVAWHLAVLFSKKQEIKINHIWSRNRENAESLKQKLTEIDNLNKDIEISHSVQQLDFSKIDADLAILSIADGAFERVLSKLILPKNCILVHTSGAQPMEMLKLANQNVLGEKIEKIGVFYPLQTFSKAKVVDFSSIPFCIEASEKEIEEKLTNLAKQFSTKVFQVSSKDRSILHVAAVFACNFSNYLWTISEQILKEKNLPFYMLKPLLEETLQKALEINPSNAQTGPAIRNDKKVIEKHLEMLKTMNKEMNLDDNFTQIYKLMTESIQKK
ncbi:DUF2520 domain-containing protein [Bernardetia sp. MNP-M8]|uniref:Rossmann-like and DUF2520 domain-containing protein n=1 Tax=Bernardetia sp. MNP-M8 TaxID=3127470 RepID=UPI0030D5D9B5